MSAGEAANVAARRVGRQPRVAVSDRSAKGQVDLDKRPVDELTLDQQGVVAKTLVIDPLKETIEKVKAARRRTWNVEAHNSISVWPRDNGIADREQLPWWLDTYPEHVKLTIFFQSITTAPVCWHILEDIAGQVDADLQNPGELRAVMDAMGSIAAKLPEYVERVWHVERPIDLVGWKVAMGRTMPGDIVIGKDNKEFNIVAEVERLSQQQKAAIPAEVIRAAVSASINNATYSNPGAMSLVDWAANPFNYPAQGSLGLKMDTVDGKRVRLVKTGVLNVMSTEEIAAWIKDARAMRVIASAKQDRDNPRAIYMVSSEVYFAYVYIKYRCGFGTPPGSASGWSGLDTDAYMEGLCTGGDYVIDSADISNFDGTTGLDTSVIFVEEFVSAARKHAQWDGDLEAVSEALLACVRNVEVYVREPDASLSRVNGDMLFSGVPWTSVLGGILSRLYWAWAVIVSKNVSTAGDATSAGDDTSATCASGKQAAAIREAYTNSNIKLSATKSLLGRNLGVFLMLYWVGKEAYRPQGRVVAGLVERNPEGSFGLFGYGQLRGLLALCEEWLARAGADVRVYDTLADILPTLLRSWGLPVRLLEVPSTLGGLGFSATEPLFTYEPKAAPALSSNPFVTVPAKAAAVMAASLVEGMRLTQVEREAVTAACSNYLSVQVVSPDLDRLRVDQSRDIESNFEWNIGILPITDIFALATKLVAREVESVVSDTAPLSAAKRANARLKKLAPLSGGSRFVFDAIAATLSKARDVETLFRRMFPSYAKLHSRELVSMRWKAFKAVFYDEVGSGVDCAHPLGQGWKEYLGTVLTYSVRTAVKLMTTLQLKAIHATDVAVWAWRAGRYVRLELRRRVTHLAGV